MSTALCLEHLAGARAAPPPRSHIRRGALLTDAPGPRSNSNPQTSHDRCSGQRHAQRHTDFRATGRTRSAIAAVAFAARRFFCGRRRQTVRHGAAVTPGRIAMSMRPSREGQPPALMSAARPHPRHQRAVRRPQVGAPRARTPHLNSSFVATWRLRGGCRYGGLAERCWTCDT
jgi:hypothetical protein